MASDDDPEPVETTVITFPTVAGSLVWAPMTNLGVLAVTWSATHDLRWRAASIR